MVHVVQVRADAVRNRTRILEAARELLAEQGAEAPMDAIAARAGVAVGTLYRHWPMKADLVAAVVEHSIEQLADVAEGALGAVRQGADPGAEFERTFRVVAERYATDRVVKGAAGVPHEVAEPEDSAAPGGRLALAVEEMIRAAGRAGRLRDDVTVADLVVVLEGVPGPDAPESARDRYIDIVLRGMRAG
jgi:AcrR family transcriptional regulator